MKILHIIDSLSIGGAENLVCTLAINQKKLGCEVRVVELVKPNNPALRDKIADAGVADFVLSNSNPYNPFLSFKLICHFKWADIAHVHLFPALYWSVIGKIFGFCNVPLVYTEHSTNNKRRNNKLANILDRFFYSRYKEIIACSDKAKDTFHDNFPKLPISVIPNGIDIETFTKAKSYSKIELLNVEEECFIISMVANFRYPKRQDILIKVMRELPSCCHLVLVGGGGENLSKFQSLANELNVNYRVHFLGVRSDVPSILKSSDIIVLASEYEGLSLSSIEGMSVKPFIASDVNGLREVVAEAGLLFDIDYPEQLSNHILKLMNDKVYYLSVKEKCKNRARSFDIIEVTKKYISIYGKYVK